MRQQIRMAVIMCSGRKSWSNNLVLRRRLVNLTRDSKPFRDPALPDAGILTTRKPAEIAKPVNQDAGETDAFTWCPKRERFWSSGNDDLGPVDVGRWCHSGDNEGRFGTDNRIFFLDCAKNLYGGNQGLKLRYRVAMVIFILKILKSSEICWVLLTKFVKNRFLN